jgi:predicted permease
MPNLVEDLRSALRSLKKRPGFVAVIVTTLALGIGVNTAVFTVVNGALLAPLPYEEPERLVRLYQASAATTSYENSYVTGMGFLTYREYDEIFEGLAAVYTYRQQGADLTGGDEPQRIAVMPTSTGFFEVLGVPPAMGRELTREEETRDARVAIISHGLWQRHLQGAADALGRTITLDGVPLAVIGIMPEGFLNPIGGQVDAWVPEHLVPGGRNSWGNFYLSVIGRLRHDMTLEQARERLRTLHTGLIEEIPQLERIQPVLLPLRQDIVGDRSAMLRVLMGAVGLVLLIACVNVANVFLAHGAGRKKEMAVRAALGARRRRLVVQLLSESIVLAALGGAAGFSLAVIGVRVLLAMGPEALPRIEELGIDTTVLLFTMAASLMTGLLFGSAPALRFSRPDLERALRESERGQSFSRTHRRMHSALVVAEVSVALVLLVGAGLLIKSFAALQEVEIGVRPDNVLTYEVHLPSSNYAEAEERVAFYERFFDRVRALPGIEAIGSASYLPTEGQYHIWGAHRTDVAEDSELGDWQLANIRVVDGDFFEVMQIPLLRGRLLEESDRADTPFVVVVNQLFAERYIPDREPLGVTLQVGGDETWEIVGIVADTALTPQGRTEPMVYIPHNQFAHDRNWAMIQTVRTRMAPAAMAGQIRAELHDIDPDLVLYKVRTMDAVVAAGVSPARFSMTLMGLFAGLALLLAAVGIYGVLSYAVNERAHEIGIRMALGAERSRVLRMVVGQGLALATAGTLLGLAGAYALSGWLSSLVFEVQVTDPWVFASVVVVLGIVAGLAGYLPARRATAIDPVSALRNE